MTNTKRLREIADKDVESLEYAEAQYGSSWKKRGGVGAFMMAARKWDRLETALAPSPASPHLANGSVESDPVAVWDIFGAMKADTRDEGIIDDIRDLRRYLMLIETEFDSRPTAEKNMAAYFDQDTFPVIPSNVWMSANGEKQIEYGTMEGEKIVNLYLVEEMGASGNRRFVMSEEHREEYA